MDKGIGEEFFLYRPIAKGYYTMPDLDLNLSLDDVLIANALCDMYEYAEAQEMKAITK